MVRGANFGNHCFKKRGLSMSIRPRCVKKHPVDKCCSSLSALKTIYVDDDDDGDDEIEKQIRMNFDL